MKTNKDDVQETIAYLICRYLAGDITAEEKELLGQWRKASAANEAAFQRLLNPQLLDKEQRRRTLISYERPLEDMKRRLALQVAPAAHAPWRRALLVAASLLVLVGLGAVLWFHNGTDETSPSKVVATTDIQPGRTQAVLTLDDGQRIALTDDVNHNRKIMKKVADQHPTSMSHLSTPRGGEFKVVLEDGTEVWLNADSRLTYPEKFGKSERRVQLEGEAFFKVTKNPEKPFYVVSGSQEVRVYGTEFNVEAYPDDNTIYTTLVSGRVSLKSLHAVTGEVMLSPGHQALYSQATETARIREVDTDVVTSWRKGMFVFENENLSQIMRQLSRWYDFDYKFADAHVADIVFMGSIPRYSTFAEVVEVFSKVGGIKLTRQGKTVIVSAE